MWDLAEYHCLFLVTWSFFLPDVDFVFKPCCCTVQYLDLGEGDLTSLVVLHRIVRSGGFDRFEGTYCDIPANTRLGGYQRRKAGQE